ncbi:MAG: hypothetical protein K0S34_936 [Bacillales bacterium]|jgi:hypothetical protein|nr:hypothetical protein [Bacillales bacterium]
MNNKRIIFTALLTIGIGFTLLNVTNAFDSNITKKDVTKPDSTSINNSNQVVFSKETDHKIVSTTGLFDKLFDNMNSMFVASDIVAEVEVNEQDVRQTEAFDAETRSKVIIVKLFRGDPYLEEALVVEIGGPVNKSKGESPTTIESALEGVPVMKKGNSYIVFLRKSPPVTGVTGLENGFYSIQGSVQGKIKLDKEKNIAVATVDPSIINEEIHFFQKMFAGKDINLLEDEINKLK